MTRTSGDFAAPALQRRTLLAAAALAPLAPLASLATLAACAPGAAPAAYTGGWVGADAARGHALRERKAAGLPAPDVQRRAGEIVVGGGVAGLAAARALMRAGVDDVHLLELEDGPGGNARGHVIAGMACPLGAHYLPLPGDAAVDVIELLEAFGLRTTERGVPVYDERHLCHSPQERLLIDGVWHDGLLPPIDALPAAERAATLAQYRQFAAAVGAASADLAFAMPTARSRWSPRLAALDATAFGPWLDAQGLTAPALRWYLDHGCRDDYGAGAMQVSAWAGLHYFASRHGFHAPGEGSAEREGVLTWPEGNAWLTRRLAAPLGERLHSAQVVLRVAESRSEVTVDVWDARRNRLERWAAAQVVLAVPLFVAARLLESPPAALVQAAAEGHYAPWLVANLHLDTPLADRPGAAPSWDNVAYDPGRASGRASGHASGDASPALGYVDAMHQSTRSVPGATVLTAYWALGGGAPEARATQRGRLLAEPWSHWANAVLRDLERMHPDLPAKLRHVDLMRYGHAMRIPLPGARGSAALRALAAPQRRVHYAHSDLSGYSVFEEALYHGTRAGRAALGGAAAARALR